MYILERTSEEFDFLSTSRQLRELKDQYFRASMRGARSIKPLLERKVEDNETVLDSNRYLEAFPEVTLEGSRFLWLPWALILSSEISRYCNANAACFQAPALQSSLASRLDKLFGFVEADPTLFVTAESLLAVNYFLRTTGEISKR